MHVLLRSAPLVLMTLGCRAAAPVRPAAAGMVDRAIVVDGVNYRYKLFIPRVYLTGLSMGGYGSWELAAAHPELFAAAAIICGGVVAPGWDALLHVRSVPPGTADPYAWVAGRLGGLPVWVFHGDADNTVPVTESRRMVDALTRAGGEVRYTEYPGVGHNAWDRTYADPALWRWLLAHERRRAR